MDCNIIRDLIPLYIDGCCSEESAAAVEAHIAECEGCREILDGMRGEGGVFELRAEEYAPKRLRRVDHWRASILQSALFLISFAIIAVGVALEASTPLGLMNGIFAVNLTVPATGFMLSLTNWYFVRLYGSKKRFSNASLVITAIITVIAYIWTVLHYGETGLVSVFMADADIGFSVSLLFSVLFMRVGGIALTLLCCIVSKYVSGRYADLLGKE